ncbi:hypothetical protein FPJ38_16725 [Mycobacterium tuberculosis]|nr:hypothetical protein EBQ37_16925 [Mycobacterium tuberculosis variant bovis BCG]QOP04881.1 hypothetical protein FPJ38_16725 [Mycobacterium tuberculosis]
MSVAGDISGQTGMAAAEVICDTPPRCSSQAYDQGISKMLFRTSCISSPCHPLGVVFSSTGRSQVHQVSPDPRGAMNFPASASPGRRTWSRYDGNLERCRAAQHIEDALLESLPDPVRFPISAKERYAHDRDRLH